MLLINFIAAEDNNTITFNHFYIEDTIICSDDYSYINIFPKDENNNSVSLDGLTIKSSLNQSGQLIESPKKDIYTLIIYNFSEINDKLDLEITGTQNGKFININKTFDIVKCKNLEKNVENILDKIENNFRSNWIYYMIGVIFVMFLIIFITILRIYSKEN